MFFLSNDHANASTEDRVKIKLHLDRLAAAVQPSHGTTTGEKRRRKGSFARLQSPLRRSLPAGVPQRWLQTQGARPGWGLWKHSLQLLSCGTITRDSLEMFNLALPAWKTHFPTSATGRVFARSIGGRGLLARDARQAFFPGRLADKCHLPVPSAHPEARDSAAFNFFNGHRDVHAEAREVHKLNAPSSSSSETGSQIEREGAARREAAFKERLEDKRRKNKRRPQTAEEEEEEEGEG